MSQSQFSWQSNDGSVPLLLEVQREFVSASGLSPTVEVTRVSDEYFADWTTQTFKAPNGSGHRLGSMSEMANIPGVYKRLFNPVNFQQTLIQQTYIVTYKVTIPSGYTINNETFASDTDLTQTETHFFTDFVGSGVTVQQGMSATFVG